MSTHPSPSDPALNFAGKNVLVMGLGLHGGGVGAVRYLARAGAQVSVTDLRTKLELSLSLKELSGLRIRYTLGKHIAKDIDRADIILKNPGVPPSSLFIKRAQEKKIPITSDIGIFFKLSPAPIIAVTGTRGKSTTAHLIAEFLKKGKQGGRVYVGGNIRTSVLELLPKIRQNDLTVLELSSFQLHDLMYESEKAQNLFFGRPEVAVMTNIFPDHENWHRSMEKYQQAKTIIFSFQSPHNTLYINPDDPRLRTLTRNARSEILISRLPKSLIRLVDEKIGKHYRSSVALAISVAERYGVSLAACRHVLSQFKGLEGRQEILSPAKGVHYVNDTTSTIPEATIAAISRFRALARGKKLILIAGGQDKKLTFTHLTSVIKKSIDVLILLPGTATDALTKQLKRHQTSYTHASSMKEAVSIATSQGEKGDWVILSPGAASFGLFKNEFDRGDQFVEAVAHIKKRT